MTIPGIVRIPLLLGCPAAAIALAGTVPGAMPLARLPSGPVILAEAAMVGPAIALLALVCFGHDYERRGRPFVDSLVAGAGMAGLFLVAVARVAGWPDALSTLGRTLESSTLGRGAMLGGILAGFFVPLAASLAELLPGGRWTHRAIGLFLALTAVAIAVAWRFRSADELMTLLRQGGRVWSWRGEWPAASGLGALLLVVAGREAAWSRLLRVELTEEVGLGILPATHVPILVSPFRRRLPGWWPKRAERSAYVDAVLRLVFRKGQMRGMSRESGRIAQLEVLRLRERIREMLAPVEPPLEETLGGAATGRPRAIDLSSL